MKRTLTLLTTIALGVTTVGCATTTTSAPPLTPADAAVCDQLVAVLADFEAGYSATEAFERNASGTWPAGMPSDQIRGVVNLHRQWVATEENERSGFATYDDSVKALGEAIRARKNLCGK